MSKTKRARYPDEFKARVVREALKENTTLVEIEAKFKVHPNQTGNCKTQAIEGLANVFFGKTERGEVATEAQITDLLTKIR